MLSATSHVDRAWLDELGCMQLFPQVVIDCSCSMHVVRAAAACVGVLMVCPDDEGWCCGLALRSVADAYCCWFWCW